MTQREIAAQLGVSQTAVSLVLNQPETTKVSPAKKQRILQLLRDSGHVGAHQERKCWNIGYVVDTRQDLHNEFYRLSIAGIEKTAARFGYALAIETFRGGELRLLEHARVDGLIIRSGAAYEKLRSSAVPVVLLNCAARNLSCDTVMPDNAGGMFHAVDRLVALGHRRIAFLGGAPRCSPFSCNFRERLAGFRQAAELYGISTAPIELLEREVAPDELTRRRIGEILTAWLALPRPPTATITVNRLYAELLLEQAARLGIRVPEELSVIGGDNKAEIPASAPELSTLEQDISAMGETAAELLFQRLAEPGRMLRRVDCDMKLVERGSCAIARPAHTKR